MTMPKRHLGNTGIEVSVMGFGASPLGGIFRVSMGPQYCIHAMELAVSTVGYCETCTAHSDQLIWAWIFYVGSWSDSLLS